MAYLRDLVPECAYAGCSKKATKELVNRFNAPIGCYCTQHALIKFKIASAQEAVS